jgi:hypothetical protein
VDQSLLTFAHLLVFAYWLGGDVGAFVASWIVTDAKASTDARLTAARILSHVDMAPRSALVLAAPTGLALAASSGWTVLPAWTIAALWIASLLWLALLWRLHLLHAPAGSLWRKLDSLLRWIAIAALLAAAASVETALFLRIKLALLAGAIVLGLFIRHLLAGMGTGLDALARGDADTPAVAAMALALSRARTGVAAIWIVLLSAALLGVARPT